MYTSEKNTKQLTVGGGSTLTVSLTVKYPGFFFDDFPYVLTTILTLLSLTPLPDLMIFQTVIYIFMHPRLLLALFCQTGRLAKSG